MWETIRQLGSMHEDLKDPRCNGWPFTDHIYQPIAFILGYWLFLLVAPRLMKNRPAFDLKWLIVPYNFTMSAISGYMTIEYIIIMWKTEFNFVCQPVDYSNDEYAVRLVKVTYLFFLTKVVELLDTVFFVLRKKTEQITFLHVYHHSTTLTITWFGMRYFAGGEPSVYALLNSLVHTVMYLYYGLSAIGPHMRPYLWWKKYLTQLQLCQFITITTHAAVALMVECSFPRFWSWALVFVPCSHAALFLNFYYKAYHRKPAAHKKNGVISTSVANGKVANGNGHAHVSNGYTAVSHGSSHKVNGTGHLINGTRDECYSNGHAIPNNANDMSHTNGYASKAQKKDV